MTKLELWYTKLVFRLSTQKRMDLMKKLASLLRNDFTLMNALNRLEMIESKNGTKPKEPFAIVLKKWQKNLERGMSFSEATKGWLPVEETLLVTSGNLSDLVIALDKLSLVVEGSNKIKKAMIGAIAYPLFLLLLTFGIIIMVGVYLVPPLTEIAGNGIIWRGAAASLIWLSNISIKYWYVFLLIFFGSIIITWISLPNWSGKLRAKFDNFPPWSIYKIKTSVGWLMSLSSMIAAGITLPDAMRMLADNANKYLYNILEQTLHFIANGDNLGHALSNTKLNFPDEEIIGDLEIYADMNEFDKNLSKIASGYLDYSIGKMETISNILNGIGILLVSLIIAWVVLGTFQIQDQITAVLS